MLTSRVSIFLILGIFLVGFVHASCIDSDAGIVYSTQGETSSNGTSYQDYCSLNGFFSYSCTGVQDCSVIEYSCLNDSIVSSSYSCQDGCGNGACKDKFYSFNVTYFNSSEREKVLFMSFNDGSFSDLSGKNNSGQCIGSACPIFVDDGISGKALQFDGSDDYVLIPASETLNVGNKFTLEAWIKPTSLAQFPVLEWNSQDLSKNYTAGYSGTHMWVNTYGYQWEGKGAGANLINKYGEEISGVISTSNPPLNVWSQIVVSFDSATGISKVYINGELKGTKTFSTDLDPITQYNLFIGRRLNQQPGDGAANGLIDEISIYHYQLTDAEVFQAYSIYNSSAVYFSNNTSDLPIEPIVPGNFSSAMSDGTLVRVEAVASCGGCLFENKCFPMGYRKNTTYCSESLAFVNQSSSEEVCNNNFECDTNICVSGKCISDSVIQKFFAWFKAFFG